MFCQETFDPWRSTIMTHLPHLSKTRAAGLALWRLGGAGSREKHAWRREYPWNLHLRKTYS